MKYTNKITRSKPRATLFYHVEAGSLSVALSKVSKKVYELEGEDPTKVDGEIVSITISRDK